MSGWVDCLVRMPGCLQYEGVDAGLVPVSHLTAQATYLDHPSPIRLRLIVRSPKQAVLTAL